MYIYIYVMYILKIYFAYYIFKQIPTCYQHVQCVSKIYA